MHVESVEGIEYSESYTANHNKVPDWSHHFCKADEYVICRLGQSPWVFVFWTFSSFVEWYCGSFRSAIVASWSLADGKAHPVAKLFTSSISNYTS